MDKKKVGMIILAILGFEEKTTAEKKDGRPTYIRPIALFQAQPKTSEDSETFDKIKAMLPGWRNHGPGACVYTGAIG